MYGEDLKSVGDASVSKIEFLNRGKRAYILSAVMAALYVGFGIMLAFTIGGILDEAGSVSTRIIMGASFGVALSLVVFAGSELFTGNNFVMTIGMLQKKVTLRESLRIWGIAYLGNFLGAIIGAIAFVSSGLAVGGIGEFIIKNAIMKTSIPAGQLIVRGILCNILVCLAVWCTFRLKSESAKLIMIFWCLFAFVTAGFEHSIANMSLIGIGVLLTKGVEVSIFAYLYNLFFVTIGNIIGGVLLASIYNYISNSNKVRLKKLKAL